MTDYAQYECTLCGELVTGYSNYHLHKCKPRERTEDWIPKGYVQDEPYDLNPLVRIPDEEEKYKQYKKRITEGKNTCKHGIYKLVSPRKLICTNCQTVIIDTQEMDGIADWMYSLCRGA